MLRLILSFVTAMLLPHKAVFAQERPRIYLGASTKTLGYSPLWVGAKRGFFEQQGLDVQVVLLRGVPMTLQALASGSLQVGTGGPEPYIEASERGIDFAIAGGLSNGMTQVLIAGKNYRSLDDLRGATLGVSSLTSSGVTALKETLKQKALEFPRDYKLPIVAGGSASTLMALQSGQIAATIVAIPLNYAVEEAGMHTLARLIDTVPNFQASALEIKRSCAEKNHAAMVRFMKTMVLSNRWLYDNRDAAVELIAKEMQVNPTHALKGWEYYTQNRLWSVDGEPNIEGMKHNLRIYAELSPAKPPVPDVRKFLELSYLNEALAELRRR